MNDDAVYFRCECGSEVFGVDFWKDQPLYVEFYTAHRARGLRHRLRLALQMLCGREGVHEATVLYEPKVRELIAFLQRHADEVAQHERD